MINPFKLSAYISPGYFCDRKVETEAIVSAMQNGRNVTLFSIRRMGKTGLIYHCLYKLRKQNTLCFMVDIYATRNAKEFVNELGSKIMGNADSLPKKMAKKLKDLILSFRPRVTYEELTGIPSVEFYLQENNPETTLTQILGHLEKQQTEVVIAIDEFQQITKYPETNFEATLRTHIQHLKNIRFIFSGSETDLLISMFRDVKRPFYLSTQMLHLDPIPRKQYASFIKKWMKKGDKNISDEALERIMELTRIHTYYVQVLCNRLFSTTVKNIGYETVNLTLAEILKETEYTYFNYRKILSAAQWQLLKAVAKTGKLRNPNSKDFLYDHRLGAGSSVRRALQALTDKDMVTYTLDDEGGFHQVSDVFLEKWLQ